MKRTVSNLCAVRRRQQGVGLIEVLIAVLILSVGLLGLASLQLWTLKNNQSSLERSMAVVQTHSIVDAMHADRTAALAGDFDLDIEADAPAGATFAAVSLVAWRASLVAALGTGAKGGVDCDGSLCTISVRWNDQRGTAGDDELTIETQVQI